MEKKTNTFLFSIITFLNTCFRWKKTLIYVVFATAIITSIIMLIVPKTFTSYAQIYPTRGQQVQGINSNIGSFIASGLIGSADSDIGLMASILQSNALLNHLIDTFNLFDVYDLELRQEIRQALRKDYSVSLTDNGAFYIEIKQKTPWLSSKEESESVQTRTQDMLKEVIAFVDDKNVFLKTQDARFQREFLEKKFDEETNYINVLQDSLITFQNKYGVFSYENQVESAVSLILDLKREILIKETELYVLEQLSPDNNAIEEVRINIYALQEQLDKLEKRNVNSISDMLLPNLYDVPEVAITFQRLLYEVEMRAEFLKFIGTQLEQARIQEAKDTPTIQIIDEPSYPEKRTFPQRTKTVIIAVIAIFLLTMLIINIIESIRKYSQQNTTFSEEYTQLKHSFRNIFKFK